MAEISQSDYYDKFPSMDDVEWKSSNSKFDLGWISGLFEVADKSIKQIFSGYTLEINENDLLDLEFDTDQFTEEGIKPLIYISVWVVLAFIFTLAGLIWFCCNKCLCCCRSSFKGRGNDVEDIDRLQITDPNFDFQPRYSQRNKGKFTKPSSAAILISVLMAFWLISLLIMMLHTYGANEKTHEGVKQISPDLENGIVDIINYIGKSISQLSYTFAFSYDKMAANVRKLAETCDGPEPVCETVKNQVEDALGNSNTLLKDDLEKLSDALNDIQLASNGTKDDLDDHVENLLDQAITTIYWIFMIFNLLYLAVFILVLVGTILAVFALPRGLKLSGYLLMRIAIVMIFLMGIFVVFQLVTMLVLGGAISEVACPVVKGLYDEDSSSSSFEEALERLQNKRFQNSGGYQIPGVGKIIRSCKADESAYKAFALDSVMPLSDIERINKEFEFPIPEPEVPEAARKIKLEVQTYTKFVQDAVESKTGKCKPAFDAIDNLVNLFCHKIPAPIISYWWILQFVAVVFLLIIITALVFERLHF